MDNKGKEIAIFPIVVKKSRLFILSPLLSCYGVQINPTPNLDKLAQNGVQFTNAYMPAPVCSACRSGIITGTMPTSLGLHNHHSSRTKESAIYLPDEVKTIPELFKEAGYYTFNNGKDDYNFYYDRKKLYEDDVNYHPLYGLGGVRIDLAALKDKQPFFGQIQLSGGKHNKNRITDPIDRNIVDLPPYYPDHTIMRDEWAHHYDCVRYTDQEVGDILNELRSNDLLNNTIVFFFSDHGMGSIRHKQFLYDGGIHVPCMAAWYGGDHKKLKPGTVREDLISGIDLGTTSLALAGIEIPDYMEGKNLFAEAYQQREFVITVRDRCDFTIDRIRAVRTKRYKYIRNFMTDRPYMQPQYRDDWESTRTMRKLYEEGKLNPVQARFMSNERPVEEFYDLETDPHEINNLADDPAYSKILKQHRLILENWIKDTDDKGQYPESKEGLKFMLGIWGERAVNPEYDPLREEFKGFDGSLKELRMKRWEKIKQ
ncbi:sulfatase [Planctomycetota bacterium]